MGGTTSNDAAAPPPDARPAREPFWSHRVKRWQLQPGDHLYVWSSIVHHHHGVYVGNQRVIHVYGRNKSESRITLATLDQFASGRQLRRARYGRPWWEVLLKGPGTCYDFPRDPGPVVAHRAFERLGQATAGPAAARWEYNVLRSNCESFCLQLTAPAHESGSHQAQQLTRFNPLATLFSGVRARLTHYAERVPLEGWRGWLLQSESRRRLIAAKRVFLRRLRRRFPRR